MHGDIAAAQAVLHIVMARGRVLGLYDQRSMEQFTPRTVVLSAEDLARLGL